MSWEIVNPSSAPAKLCAFADSSFFSYTYALSRTLMSDAEARQYPDLVALGYWLRKSNIQELADRYQNLSLRPLGKVFHAAPGNVDSLFVYSGILSLLCGNINIIRLSNKYGGSAEVLCRLLAELAVEHPDATARFQLIRCERHDPYLRELQANIDGRILWGSNEGVQALRQVPMPAHTRELVFAHKLSFCVLGIDAVLRATDAELNEVVVGFARDNLTFAQQACASAKLILWLGEKVKCNEAQGRFWRFFGDYMGAEVLGNEGGLSAVTARDKYQLTESEHYQALNNAQDMAMSGIIDSKIEYTTGVLRAWTNSFHNSFTESHQGSGLFVETQIERLTDLNEYLTPNHQTLSYWGVDSIDEWHKQCLVGVDRVVPIGQALNFDVVWDGLDLVRALGRESV